MLCSVNRGAIKKKNSKLIAFWVPTEICIQLDKVVRLKDLDRSKVIRAAIQSHLASLSISDSQ